MSEKLRKTEIYLVGGQAIALLERNGVTDENRLTVNEKGEILLVSFTERDQLVQSAVGDIGITYGAVDQGEDSYGNTIHAHQVTLDVSSVQALQGQRYKNKNRRIHLSKFARQGKQKVRKGVELVIKTNVPRTIFERNVRS